jgi:TPR repeat protein
MKFLTAVALAAVMLWVPVDGVAQTQAEREMLQLYESRERQLLASMNPEADRAESNALLGSCTARALAGSGRRGGIAAGMAECTDRLAELGNRQAARRNSLQQELFALRRDKLELERRIGLVRASPPPPKQPEDRPRVTASAGATAACPMSAEELRSLNIRVWQRDAVAQAELGSFYHSGICVPQDYPESHRLARLAAEQGNPRAQNGLGFMYARGDGVPEDLVFAYMWFNLAAAQGNEVAKGNKDGVEARMTREQIAEAQRMSREWIEAHR